MNYESSTSKKGYVNSDYLTHTAHIIADIKKRTYELMAIKISDKVLDVGCGPGIDTGALATLVGSSGLVCGVDNDPRMIEEAVEEAVNDNTHHFRSDADNLPFPDYFFDACRSERLFQHLNEPDKTIAEMARVTKHGGRIVVADTDWGTLSTNTSKPETERALSRHFSGGMLNNGYSGRSLYELFVLQGLSEVEIEVKPVFTFSYDLYKIISQAERVQKEALKHGLVTENDLSELNADYELKDEKKCFFSCVNVTTVWGVKK